MRIRQNRGYPRIRIEFLSYVATALAVTSACSGALPPAEKLAPSGTYGSDIDYLIALYENNHPGLHPDLGLEYFIERWTVVREKLLELKSRTYEDPTQFTSDLVPIIGLLASSHDYVKVSSGMHSGSKSLPLRFGLAYPEAGDDGSPVVYVSRCDEAPGMDCSRMLYAAVLQVGSNSITEYLQAEAGTVNAELTESIPYRVVRRMHRTLARRESPIRLGLRDANGKDFSIEISSAEGGADSLSGESFDIRVVSSPVHGNLLYMKVPIMLDRPMCRQVKEYRGYSEEYCNSLPELKEWVKEATRLKIETAIDRVVFDFRGNTGGWSSVVQPLLGLCAGEDLVMKKTAMRKGELYFHRSLKSWLRPLAKELRTKIEQTSTPEEQDRLQNELRECEEEIRRAEFQLEHPLPLTEQLESRTTVWEYDGSSKLGVPCDFLADAGSWSATEITLMGVHGAGVGRVIGEPSGNGCCVFTEGAIARLPKSSLEIRFALALQSWPDESRCAAGPAGVPVDIFVLQTYEDVLNNIETLAKQVYGINRFDSVQEK